MNDYFLCIPIPVITSGDFRGLPAQDPHMIDEKTEAGRAGKRVQTP